MFRPGDTFDRYRIERTLGEGGMGLVYQAYDTRLRRRIALKVLRPEVARAEDGKTLSEAALRLMREGRAAAALNHPNAVGIFDVGEIDGTPYIAMELVRGKSLNELLGDMRVPLRARVRWMAAVAHALGAAHQKGLVHRDVKPENVMVCDDGSVKILDFGVVKRVGSIADPRLAAPTVPGPASLVTRAGVVIGTPLYMAPEQVLGEPVDGRSDQFAWGVVAYELLSGGVHPASTNNPRNLPIQFAILQETPKSLREVAADVPPELDAVIMRAIAKTPEARFESMHDVASALERILETMPDDGRPERPISIAPSSDDEPTINVSSVQLLDDGPTEETVMPHDAKVPRVVSPPPGAIPPASIDPRAPTELAVPRVPRPQVLSPSPDAAPPPGAPLPLAAGSGRLPILSHAGPRRRSRWAHPLTRVALFVIAFVVAAAAGWVALRVRRRHKLVAR